MNRSVLNVVLSLVLGIASATYIDIGLNVLIGIICGLFVVLIGVHKLASRYSWVIPIFGIVLTLQCYCIGAFALKTHLPSVTATHYMHHKETTPQNVLFSVIEVLKPSSFQDKYIIQLHQLDSVKATGSILLNVQRDSLMRPLKVGQWYVSRSLLEDLPELRYPYQFDYGKYLKQRGIYNQITTHTEHILTHQKVSNTPRVWAARFRESAIKTLENHAFSTEQLSVLKALILGQRQDIDSTIKDQYAAAGLMHILAVSGLHVGLVLLLLRFFLSPLKHRRWRLFTSIIVILGVWSFAFITGLSPSVLRAATMFTFLEIGNVYGGQRNTLDAVLVSALILLCIDPLLIYHVGFQLSYLAVISILYIQPWLAQFYKPRFYIDKMYWGVLTVTIAAQLGVFPLSIFYFHQFPGLFFISNMIVLPFLGIILALGICVVILAQLQLLPDLLVNGYGGLIDLLNASIAWVAQQESFVFQHLNISLTVMLSIYAVITFGFNWLFKKTFFRAVLALVTILGLIVILIWEKAHPTPSQLTIFQQSKSTLIGRYEHKALLLYTADSLFSTQQDYRIKAYRNALPIDSIQITSIPNVLIHKKKKILIIDKDGIYDTGLAFHPDIILLRTSPDINLSRLIQLYPNITVIADGSNYKSDIDRWRITCLKKKIPFHSTYEKGAYTMY